MVFVSGPDWIPEKADWQNIPSLILLEWGEVHDYTQTFYDQYRAVLEADVEHRDFEGMQTEVRRTRTVLADGAYRGEQVRLEGLGYQHVDYQQEDKNEE